MPWRSSGASARGALQLRPQLLVAARRGDQDPGVGAQAEVERMVGRGVAGMERDHHVDRSRLEAAQVTLDEAQSLAARPGRGGIAEGHQVGRSSTPVTSGAPPKRRCR
jgi:hypothetical protein